MLLITDPVGLHHILVTNSYNWPKPDQIRGEFKRIVGTGLLFAEGDDHRCQKRIITPAFASSHLKQLLPVFFENAHILRNKWNDLVDCSHIDVKAFASASSKHDYVSTKLAGLQEAVIDVPTWFGRLTLDIIGATGFGYRFGALEDSENSLAKGLATFFSTSSQKPTAVTLIVVKFLGGLMQKLPFLELIPHPTIQSIRRAFQITDLETRKIVREKKAELIEALRNGDTPGKDLITLLLKSNLESVDSKNTISDAELQGQMTTFALAGHETTATALTWTVFTLAKDPVIQTRLRVEIKAAMAEARKAGREILNSEELGSLSYLDAVCREVLRFEPPAPENIRISTKDDSVPLSAPITTKSGKTLSSLPVSANTVIYFSIIACNMSKEIFGEDADVFRPERWLEGHVGEKVHGVGVYSNQLTFLAGPRACIGIQFALLELKAVLVVLIDNFHFLERNAAGPTIERRTDVITRPVVFGEEALGSRLPLRVRRA